MHGEGTLEYCRQHNITIQAWGPLKSGAVITGEADPPSQAAQDVARLVGELAAGERCEQGSDCAGVAVEASGEDAGHHRHDEAGAHQGACEADGVELTRDEWYRLFIAGRGDRMP